MKRSISLCGGALLAALPLVALATGCSGGNGGGIGTPTATPTGTSVPTITPTTASTTLGSAPVSFGNGQTGTFTLSRAGNNVTGNLVVNPAIGALARKTRAFNFVIPAGTYVVSGTINPLASPITFSVTGNFPAPVGQFAINGSLPTTTSSGTYTLTAAGQTVNGTYPPLGGIIPTATPTGNATPTPTTPIGLGGSFNLTLTQTADSNFGYPSFEPNAIAGTRTSSGLISIGANYNATPVSQSRSFIVFLLPSANPLKAGDKVVLGLPGLSNYYILVGGYSAGKVSQWNTTGGELEITAISNTSISGKLIGATFQPTFSTSAKGTLTFNGTFQSNLAPA